MKTEVRLNVTDLFWPEDITPENKSQPNIMAIA